jgi:hypothetical protein
MNVKMPGAFSKGGSPSRAGLGEKGEAAKKLLRGISDSFSPI